ncbi:MAG: Rieske (2Fe-2S) protein [Bacteroidales bacterium]|nr:Rieske (2Fe-2S) protein [Bacteroidales bacterium]
MDDLIRMKHKISRHIEPNNIETTGRRKFLSRIWKILGLVALAELAFFTISMLRPGRKNLKDHPELNFKVAGNIEDFPINSVTADRVNKFFLIRSEDGGFLALSLICSHLGCSVLWDKTRNQFVCPCHSSAFDRVGNVINSPAPRALDYFPVLIEGGKIKVDLGQKKSRKKFENNQVTYAI